MIQQAIASDDPIVFLEPKRRYWEKGDVDTDPSLAGRVPAALRRASCRRARAYGRPPYRGLRPDGPHRPRRGAPPRPRRGARSR